MKCQNLFSGKTKKNIITLSSAEFAKREVTVNAHWTYSSLCGRPHCLPRSLWQ